MKETSILVVDDSEADQFLFHIIVEESYPQMKIFKAYDGEQAQEMLIKDDISPDIIFLDINMPRMNGYEFLEANQSLLNKKAIKVFMLTSSNQESDINKALEYACVEKFLEKSFKIEFLKDALLQLQH
ncbi:MAG: CheY-like chemotaxis protein [Kiritimatiellia bacterium]|jgi:CheY-like chemotaxis protein